eukprot:1381496-Rhodomonas_salina.1
MLRLLSKARTAQRARPGSCASACMSLQPEHRRGLCAARPALHVHLTGPGCVAASERPESDSPPKVTQAQTPRRKSLRLRLPAESHSGFVTCAASSTVALGLCRRRGQPPWDTTSSTSGSHTDGERCGHAPNRLCAQVRDSQCQVRVSAL